MKAAKSDVKVLDFKCVVADEVSPFFDIVTHQYAKESVGFAGIVELDVEQSSGSWIHCCLP